MDKWRQKRKDHSAKLMTPFVVLWVAVSVGVLIMLWPTDREVCSKAPDGVVATIYHSASIWTGESKAHARAMAVFDNGRIACTGSMKAVSIIADQETKFVDLKGYFVTPGFIDPHVHILSGGQSLHTPDLSTVESVQELKAIVRRACNKALAGDWVQGIGWDEVSWGGPSPHKSWLDDVCPQNPVILHRMCGHKAVISSSAARLAEISAATQDPPGGKIYRDNNGITGVLAESAMDIVKAKIPPLTVEAKRQLVKDASHYLLSQGVTMAHDMGTCPPSEVDAFENLIDVYLHMAKQGELPIRLFAFTPLANWDRLQAFKREHGTSTPDLRLSWGGLKEFADGSLGSKTALFHEPYIQDPGEELTTGVRTIEKDVLKEQIQKADKAGLQVAIHAIGDLAVDDVLDVYEFAGKQNDAVRQGAKPRHRMEHAQHLHHPSVADRFASLGVHPVTNPLHLLPDKRVLKARLGTQRAGPGQSYAINTLFKAGANVSFGSDFPVVKADPLLGMFAAVYRRAPVEQKAYYEEEAVSLEMALKASTIEAARLAGLEDHLGTLRAGKLADFVLLNSDPLFMTPKFGPPKVLATYVGGKLAYDGQTDA